MTGAARGLGRVIALTLAEEGYDIVLVDLADSNATAAEVEQHGASAWPTNMDVSCEADVIALAADVQKRFGRVDVLVNNAGISLLVPAERTPTESWRRVIDVNLTGPFLLCRELGPLCCPPGPAQ